MEHSVQGEDSTAYSARMSTRQRRSHEGSRTRQRAATTGPKRLIQRSFAATGGLGDLILTSSSYLRGVRHHILSAEPGVTH